MDTDHVHIVVSLRRFNGGAQHIRFNPLVNDAATPPICVVLP